MCHNCRAFAHALTEESLQVSPKGSLHWHRYSPWWRSARRLLHNWPCANRIISQIRGSFLPWHRRSVSASDQLLYLLLHYQSLPIFCHVIISMFTSYFLLSPSSVLRRLIPPPPSSPSSPPLLPLSFPICVLLSVHPHTHQVRDWRSIWSIL